ncbi:tubulin binding cofactor C-domain-containing protein [Suillus subaureus]|uniref:Tubulin binding cofactor C-domain-containing protein n=1 Tax=Suillus subaureus TaxID=48587 RepID=A0A9P7E4U7_9AGAM|nr:tubulin binding cofactor C-domain-containing protein [Suillus subaureus]KAG1811252.1 tubulin binding cofactor C-domain-containing protein [Suillus subaureus]
MISTDRVDALWTISQTFTSSFQASCSGKVLHLHTGPTDAPIIYGVSVHSVAREIQALNKRLSEATGRLPSYDQRQNELQLKALEKALEELRSSTTVKTKFAFKRKVKISASASAETATPPAPVNAPAIPTSIISSASRMISNHSNCYLSSSCLSGPTSSTDHIGVSIIRISSSILNLLTTTNELTLSANTVSISALHIRDIQNSILILGTVDGSIMLHNLTNCGCCWMSPGRFRMHHSTAVDAYLDITSNPIIESCDQVRFGAYPSELKQLWSPKTILASSVFLPQDFSHMCATPSPNWRALEEDE